MFWRSRPRPQPPSYQPPAEPPPAPPVEPESVAPPPPPPPPPRPTLEPGFEWRYSSRLVQHFESILLRLRFLVLPLLAIATAVGAGLATRLDRVAVPLELSVAICIGAAIFVLAMGVLGVLTPPAGLRFVELGACILLAVAFAIGAYFVWDRDPRTISMATPVLLGGGLFLFLVFLTDRFYFSNLALAASERTEALEELLYWGRDDEADDRMVLARALSVSTPAWAETLRPSCSTSCRSSASSAPASQLPPLVTTRAAVPDAASTSRWASAAGSYALGSIPSVRPVSRDVRCLTCRTSSAFCPI